MAPFQIFRCSNLFIPHKRTEASPLFGIMPKDLLDWIRSTVSPPDLLTVMARRPTENNDDRRPAGNNKASAHKKSKGFELLPSFQKMCVCV